jgi:hypothetical protein
VFFTLGGVGGGSVVGDFLVRGGVGQGPRVLGTVTVLRLARITGYQRPRIRTASPGWMVAWLCPAAWPVVICWSRMPSQ